MAKMPDSAEEGRVRLTNNPELCVFEPAPHLLAFYSGRATSDPFMAVDNWVDDGALSLGIASYAVISGEQALVYDTHVSVPHARLVRSHLEDRGIRNISVLLSHHHLDHIAGTEVFADCAIISNAKTLEHLIGNRTAIESGTHSGPPAISPLILPNDTFEGERTFRLGEVSLRFIEANIHSDDATVIWIAEQGILLAGDTLEDTITYVAEPKNLPLHEAEIDRLKTLAPRRIYPNHGSPVRIAGAGYDARLMEATQDYIRFLRRAAADADLAATPLQTVVQPWLDNGTLEYFAPYARIHTQNIEAVRNA